jgi:membrane-bound serine protease (ClpP class)
MGLRAQRSKPVSGVNTLIGRTAETMGELDLQGHVKISGETWNAISLSGKIKKNQKVIVKEIKGLTLYVSSED